MVDLETRPPEQPNGPDRTTRSAALWAAAVAVPIAVLVGVLIFTQVIRRAEPAAQPAPAATAAAAVPATPVQIAAPKLSARAATVCLAVTSQLPATVRNLPARKVSAGPEQNAAYGEPPITVQCGIAQPAMCATLNATGDCVPLDTELLNMNNVCWYARQSGPATAFTTMDRETAVRVTVPSGYQQAAQWANEFSDIVVETDKSRTEGVPSGCA
jgi:Protein of unknown function (DUF3515)